MVIKCPACSMDLTVEDTAAGSQIKCPTCNTLLVVPAVSAEAPSGEESASKTFSGASDEQLARKIAAVYRQMAAEVGKAIVGQHEVIEQLFIAIFAAAIACWKACRVWRKHTPSKVYPRP